MKKVFVIGVIIIALIILAISASSCKASVAQGNTFDRSTITIQKVKQVSTGTMNWNLLDVKDLGKQIADTNGNIYPSTNGKFIFISFSVENTGTDSRTLFDLRVIDDQGRIYDICNQAYGYLGPNYSACSLVPILPKVKPQTFSATFDVDPDSKGLILEVTDLILPPVSAAYIDLGI
jgi:hypothetical protein